MPERVDKGLVYDNNIIIEVRYYPMNESNAVVLKDDQSGFEERITRKLNANDRVNNAEILGSFVRSKVNSVGGTRIAPQVLRCVNVWLFASVVLCYYNLY